MYYVLQRHEPDDPDAPRVARFSDLDDSDLDWFQGQPFEEPPAYPIPVSTTGGELPDLSEVPVPLMSRRLAAALGRAGVDNIDFYPAEILEETRHGDVLNKYLYLSGRVNMREVEQTTHHLINDGFDIGTGKDPYKNFVYTSFQELATFISHSRVSKIAKQYVDKKLSKLCNLVAGDEMRHHLAYSEFVNQIFKVDPSGMMLAFQYMMKLKITMPAHFLRESGQKVSSAFEAFSNSAQKMGVYTALDYVDILKKLNVIWGIDKLSGLTDEAERARVFLMKLPDRMAKATVYVILFDIASGKVNSIKKQTGKASGFGFRNYWLGAITNVMKKGL